MSKAATPQNSAGRRETGLVGLFIEAWSIPDGYLCSHLPLSGHLRLSSLVAWCETILG
jgi:hypothetical protein